MSDPVVLSQALELTGPRNIARAWWNAGCSVVPIQPNGTKKPTRDWKELQLRRLSEIEVERYWGHNSLLGVAIVCGKISGNLEMTELEALGAGDNDLFRIEQECDLLGVGDVWRSFHDIGYVEWTPSGGLHIIYRIEDHEVPSNYRIAASEGGAVLSETRGEGGYVIVAPTSGLCHSSGEPWTTVTGQHGEIPYITWEQREALHLAIKTAINRAPEPEPPVKPREIAVLTGELRPGDDFNLRASWEDDWFTGQGWQVSHRSHSETFWIRPGKDPREGHSASTGYDNGVDRLYIWSTSTTLPSEQPLSKFFVYAHYHHNGDMSAAARTLRQQGYGIALTPALPPLPNWDPEDASGKELVLPGHGGLDLTDTGNGRRLRSVYGDRFRYNTAERYWYEWTGINWSQDRLLSIHRAAVDIAERTKRLAYQALDQAKDDPDADKESIKKAERQVSTAVANLNVGKIKSCIEAFSAEPGITMVSEQFDRNPNLLNLPNGTLNLDSGELLTPNPDDLISLTFGAEFDKDAPCPKFRQFIEDAIPDTSVRAYIQRAMGYSLLGNPTERAMFMLHGPSGTGKSVLTTVMTEVFGGYGATAPASTFRLKKQDTTLDLHMLRRKRFVATSELPEGAALDEELIKRITGGDLVTSRTHYQEFVEWRAQCVVWIATNFLPRVNGDDNAIWRRAKTIRMPTEFGVDGRPEVPGYADVLLEERNGILNWLLEGLADYSMRGLDEPVAITLEVEAYRTDVDSVASFVRDRIEDGLLSRQIEAEVGSTLLYQMYVKYCAEQLVPALGKRRFANRLKNLGLIATKNNGISVWQGLMHHREQGFVGGMFS